MKYYLIAGEASGDLHASRLMEALRQHDAEAEFRFIGGDLMAAVGGSPVRHYRELAYMGFVPVLLHLPTILSNMRRTKQDISQWQPDVVILVDYPGFNLSIAKYVHRLRTVGRAVGNAPKVFYYISPKIWAWKEYRIKAIKRDVDELFSILPFEVPFFEQKHHYPIHYVGNPTAEEVRAFLSRREISRSEEGSFEEGDFEERGARSEEGIFEERGVRSEEGVIALLAGSRRQEIKDNLPAMIEATRHLADRYHLVLAGAPGIDEAYYRQFIDGTPVRLVSNQTYRLLSQATAALVTSGTATLETGLFGVPQVVCYETPLPRLIAFLRRRVLKVKYISLVNLIADREIVPELVADTFTVENIRNRLEAVLPGGPDRQAQLDGYADVRRILGNESAPDNAARIMVDLLRKSVQR